MNILRASQILFASILIGAIVRADDQDPHAPVYSSYGPPDAYEEGATLPYYGSESSWNHKQFFIKSFLDKYYYIRGQEQLIDLEEGHPEMAEMKAREWLAKDPQDLESRFILSLALAVTGRMPEAEAEARKAVRDGLPPERYLTQPFKYTRLFQSSPGFIQWIREQSGVIAHGPLLGAMREDGCRVWIRAIEPGETRVEVYAADSGELVAASSPVYAVPERELTAVLEVRGLRPSTTYRYQVFFNGRPALSDPLPVMKTYPARHSRETVRLVFGGCAAYHPESEKIWDTIREHQPNAVLQMGDNVYMDWPAEINAFHRYLFARRQSRPEYRRMTAVSPVYAIWDDHDSGMNDGFLGPYPRRPAWKLSYWDHFRFNWNNPAYGGGEETPGCWFSFSLGDVDIFMLDGRYYRTNPYGEHPTMLGPVQKAWLKQALAQSRASFKVIASPVSWTYESKPDSRDTWNGFPEERTELFDFLRDERIDGVILLSSDRHRSEAWRMEQPHGYPLYNFLSGRYTAVGVAPAVQGTLWDYVDKPSFGQIDFRFDREDPEAHVQYFNIDGEKLWSIALPLSTLRFEQPLE